MPSQANAPADLDRTHFSSDGRDGSDHLVSGNKGVLADAPIVSDQMQIAVADSAMGDGNFDFVWPEFARVVAEGEKFGTCRMSGKPLNLRHDYV